MKLKKKTEKITLYLILILLSCVTSYKLQVTRARAQTTLPLTVAPARQELTVDPGEKTAINLKFFNQSDAPVSGLLKVADFIVKDKEGTPELLEDLAQISPRFAAAAWVNLPYRRMTIAPNNSVLIQAKINVPLNARPGGKYVAIYFEPSGAPQAIGAPQEATIPVAVRLAGLVYLRVSGPINEGALVTQFDTLRYRQYGPVTINAEILNRGDYHIRPKGVITVTDFLGRLIDQSLLEEQNIFPDTSRTYEASFGKKWMVGRFKASLSAAYGEKGQGLTSAVYFWVFPWKEAVVVALALIILAVFTSSLRRRTGKKEKEMAVELKEKEKELKNLKEELKKKESE